MNTPTLILYEISRRMKSGNDSIFISSSDLGVSLGISQQTASRYLLNLEKGNLISRKISNEGQEIRLTSEGLDLLQGLYTNLKEFFEGKKNFKNPVLEGEVITGIGEGAYYIKEYENRIKETLGFKPFPGTLNVRPGKPQNIENYATGVIRGFEKGGRTFGNVKFLPVKIIVNSTAEPSIRRQSRRNFETKGLESKLRGQSPRIKDKSADGYLILPKRTHYRDTVEIISESNLRAKMGIKNGDKIKIELIHTYPINDFSSTSPSGFNSEKIRALNL